MAESQENYNLQPRQVKALEALLDGCTMAEAAEHASVSERTIARWMANPSFKAALQSNHDTRLLATLARLISITERAAQALFEVLTNPERKGANVKRLAAVSTLEKALDYRQAINLEERLARLEAKLGIKEGD